MVQIGEMKGGIYRNRLPCGLQCGWLRALYTRARACKFWEFDTWGGQLLHWSSNYGDFTNLQALDSLSKCKVAMLKVRCQRGNDTKQREVHGKPKNAGKPIGLGRQNESSNSQIRIWISWPRAPQTWGRACRGRSTWDQWRCHLSVVSPVKSSSYPFESSSVK